MEGIGEIIDAGQLTDMIDFIDRIVNTTDYTATDIAAAFLKQAIGGVDLSKEDKDDYDYEEEDCGVEEGMLRLFVNVGKKDKIRPGDILGAIAGEAKIPGKLVGAIDMYDNYTFVEVPKEHGRVVLKAMNKAKIKGKAVSMEPANRR